MSEERTMTFHVEGMHCSACVLLAEAELGELKEVSAVKASLRKNNVVVKGNFGEKELPQIAEQLSTVLKPHGYSVSVSEPSKKHVVKWVDFVIAIPVAATFVGLFVLLQRLNIVDLVTSTSVGYGTAFVLGLVASVSTCMAVVGGLVLSMSANYVKAGERIKPQILFHVGRLASFFLLGGLIGAIGAQFTLDVNGLVVVGILVGVVLLLLGVNLLDVFPWAKNLQLTMPKAVAERAHRVRNLNHTLTPLLTGIATFFLPCGFTQSMQVYTLGTADFWTGGLTMLFFALGTLPVLAVLSFGSPAILKKAQGGVFFKSVGLIVIFFAVFNLINSLALAGLIAPVFDF